MKTLLIGAISLLTVSGLMAEGTDEGSKRIPNFKVGNFALTILESDGIKPMAGAKMLLTKTEDGTPAASVVASPSGLCKFDVAEGRYILSVNEKPVSLITASPEGDLAWARIVLSEKPMLIGGADAVTQEEEKESKRRGAFWLTGGGAATYILGGAAVVGAGVGAAAVIDNNNNDSKKTGSTKDTTTTPEPIKKPSNNDGDNDPVSL